MGRKTRVNLDKREQDLIAFSELFRHEAQRRMEQKKSHDPLAHLHSELMPFQNLAIRPLDTFKPQTRSHDRGKLLLEAARHCFGPFRVPSILNQVWTSSSIKKLGATWEGSHPRQWYAQIATGQSFYKSCVKDRLTRKEAHVFLNCKHDVTILQGLVYAVAKCAGTDDGSALRLARSKLSELPFNEYWRNCTRFFSEHLPRSVALTNDLCDYLRWRKNQNPAFSVTGQGFNIESLEKKMIDWHHDMARVKSMGTDSWVGVPMVDWSVEREDKYGVMNTWTFHQILKAPDLAAEGNAMHHCVFSYKRSCMDGSLSIWSLRCAPQYATHVGHEERKLTIELSNDGRINQARGLANRPPRHEESHILQLWARTFDLDFPTRVLNGGW